MESQDEGLTIAELAERFKLRPRTIHFYITEGLLPSPGTRGRHVRYGEEYQLRLQVITALTRRHVPLAQIKDQLDGLTIADLRRLVTAEDGDTPEGAQAQRGPSPRDYIAALLDQARADSADMRTGGGTLMRRRSADARSGSSHSPSARGRRRSEAWRRWELVPGVELHVSDAGERRYGTLITLLLRAAADYEDRHGSADEAGGGPHER